MASDTRGKRTPLGCVLTVIGYVVLIAVLALAILMALPQILGWKSLTVTTGSMEPTLPVGSMVYMASANPADLQDGDIVVFRKGSETITHRVVSNHKVQGELITKGDANQENDLAPVPYSAVLGKVAFDAPWLGDILGALATLVGKIYLIVAALCGVMLTVLGGRLRRPPAVES